MEADAQSGVNSRFSGAIATFVQKRLPCGCSSEDYSRANQLLLVPLLKGNSSSGWLILEFELTDSRIGGQKQ